MRPAAAALLCAALLGCPDKATQPPGDERLLAKLKAEKEREAKDGPLVPPTNVEPLPSDEKVNPLAEFAAKGTQRRELPLPGKTLVDVGKVSLRLNALEATHTVGAGVSITTDDWFVKLTFVVTGPEGSDVDLAAAHLEHEAKQYGFARDAQAASHQSAHVTIGKDGQAEVSAYFEVPKEDLGQGLTLCVPDGAKEVKLELQ